MAQPKYDTKRERFNKLILAQTRKYQKIYGFEIELRKEYTTLTIMNQMLLNMFLCRLIWV